MGRLDDYRTAMLVADPAVSSDALERALDNSHAEFDVFVIAHGLGPLWYARTGRREFKESRLTAEAMYMAQKAALRDVDIALSKEGLDYAVIKGAATREISYDPPALRSCHDIDLIVARDDKLHAARSLVAAGFEATPIARSISRELVLSRTDAEIDLHWGLLREGRLRYEDVPAMLSRRVERSGVWILDNDDSLKLALVHPAFAKHLAGWDLGLHRVVDIVRFLSDESFDWPTVRDWLWQNGVSSAAWATLRWTQILTEPQKIPDLENMLSDLYPGKIRAGWLDFWLKGDLSARFADKHVLRLAGLSPFLHDEFGDVIRAYRGRRQARKRSSEDLALFADLIS